MQLRQFADVGGNFSGQEQTDSQRQNKFLAGQQFSCRQFFSADNFSLTKTNWDNRTKGGETDKRKIFNVLRNYLMNGLDEN